MAAPAATAPAATALAPTGDGTKAAAGRATVAETTEQLKAFYRKHDASKLGNVGKTATKFEGR